MALDAAELRSWSHSQWRLEAIARFAEADQLFKMFADRGFVDTTAGHQIAHLRQTASVAALLSQARNG